METEGHGPIVVNGALAERLAPWKNGFVVQVTDDALARASEALRHGDWEVARDRFQVVLEKEPSGRAWEGLAWAAWWLCDEPLNFRAREQAYRVYRAEDDALGAARAAAWLAGDYMDYRGEHVVAIGWLEQARRLLDDRELCAEHGFLALIEADILSQTGAPPARVEAVAAGRRSWGASWA